MIPILRPILRCCIIALLSFYLTLGGHEHLLPISVHTIASATAAKSPALTPLQSAKRFYDAGQFSQAAEILSQRIQANIAHPLNQSRALGLQSLVWQKLGQWDDAQTALNQALELAKTHNAPASLWAQLWNTQGHFHLAQGQAKVALSDWQTAEIYYRQVETVAPSEPGKANRANPGILGVQINQAQAMHSLGFHSRASNLLETLENQWKEQPNSVLKLRGLKGFADLLRSRGELTQAQALLQTSLTLAQQLNTPLDEAQIHLSLGNTVRLLAGQESDNQEQGQSNFAEAAIAHYTQAATLAPTTLLQTQAQLNQLSLLIEQSRWVEANRLTKAIAQQLPQLPSSRSSIYAQVNFAQSLIKLNEKSHKSTIKSTSKAAQATIAIPSILDTAIQQSEALGDRRAESYARGILGHWYETNQDWTQAQIFTDTALELAQNIEADDITYQWQWQLGRLLQQQSEEKTQSQTASTAAIAHYRQAFEILETLRGDLVSINPDLQFSFRESIEPLYRQWVDLLLREDDPSTQNLAQARSVIESLQLAELDNFFREACISSRAVNIDQIDAQAAVIYPILLPDRIETIVSFPQGQLKHYTQAVSKNTIENEINELRRRLVLPIAQLFRPSSQRLYDWLIRPLENDLAASQVTTLVFVLDGDLKNIPMAALSDGEQFLIENYNLALTPGLQLLEPQPIQTKSLEALTGGLSEARQGFSALPNVLNEVEKIQDELPAQILLDEQFTSEGLAKAVNASSSPILHLATHGQFSSEKEETFILTWDERLGVDEFSRLLRNAELKQDSLVELLVLSACQTATGDRKAPLGLAGFAVRSGARSTVASLWLIDDEATSGLMKDFYGALSKSELTKAEALRQAQLQTLKNPQFQHPYYWSAFVLLGNWL